MTLAELRARLEAINAERRAIHEAAADAALTTEQQTQWDALDTEETDLNARVAEAEEVEARTARVAASRARWGSTQVSVTPDPFAMLNGPAVNRQALVDANLRAVEGRIESSDNEAHFERVLKRHAGDTGWAQNVLARSRPEYESGWAKLMGGDTVSLSNEERAAVAIGTTTQGGYLVPTHLDPSLILTNDGSSNVMRTAGTRKVTLTEGNVWYGVTTAGVTASWDAELTEVSDDSPTVAQPSITCFKAQSFVQATIEAFADIAGLASDVLMLFADARDRLEGAAHMTGNGTTAPGGLFELVNASASLKTTSTTAATIGEVDLHALYRALPIRYRGRGTFVANPLYTLAVKRLGTAVSSSYSGDLSAPVSERWIGKPVLESDDAPTTQTTTALDQEIVFADLSAYTIVDKPGGFSVEFVPHLFNTTTNLPDGRRGWYAHWRTGAGIPNLKSARILVDKTSA